MSGISVNTHSNNIYFISIIQDIQLISNIYIFVQILYQKKILIYINQFNKLKHSDNNILIFIIKDSTNPQMQKLAQLTNHIKQWNMMGHSLLPSLELIIITDKAHLAQTQQIVRLFSVEQLQIYHHQTQNHNQNQSHNIYSNKKISNDMVQVNESEKNSNNQHKIKQKEKEEEAVPIQRVYIMKGKLYGRICVVLGLNDSQIKDQQFRARKAIIEKYRKQKYVIFLIFCMQDRKQLQKNQQHLIQFGLMRKVDNIIQYDNSFTQKRLLYEIITKYQNSFKYDLVTNYRMMKQYRKQCQKQSKRYIEWKSVINGETNPITFSLLSLRLYTQSMCSSFSGTFSSSHYQKLGIIKSINWKTMQLLHAFWQIQSDILFKQVDSFPLSYIEQQYKMSDHYSIGGFLPDTCFKAIFAPPLYQFRNSLMSTIQNIKQSILRHVQLALQHIFKHTNIKENIIQKELERIQEICEKFYHELANTLQSQIQFIHANPEDFWNYRQLNSSFYSPDQQVYIQIKYIGKSYVRKVHESIKDAVPRLIGQNLLKKIQKYIQQQSINTFIELTRYKQFKVQLSQKQITKYQLDLQTLKQLDSLVQFFSLRVNAAFLIKNFHQKKQKQWDRMFGRSDKIKIQENNQNQIQETGGILNWMKKIFKRSNKDNKKRKANSGQKKTQKPVENEQINKKDKKKQDQKGVVLNEKNWLLIINTGRQVSHDRIKQSALHGFPPKFRSSIWMYLSTRNRPKNSPKLKSLLLEPTDSQVVKQIQKDIPRTTPGQLFRYSMRNSLRNVLIGYSIIDKQIGYTQGMNFITSVIITTLINYGDKTNPLIDNRVNYEQIQEKAYCILRYIMQQCGVKKLMQIQPTTLADLSLRLNDRIKQLSPKMSTLISQTPFTCQMLFSSPLISCLSNVTSNLLLMRRFLDLLITHDFFIVYRVIAQFVAHCQFMERKINQDNVYDFLKNKMYDQVYAVVGDTGLTAMFQML